MSLEEARRKAQKEWDDLSRSEAPVISVGTATCGRSAGANGVLEALRDELAKHKLPARIVEVGCLGMCYAEPMVTVRYPDGLTVCHGNLLKDDVPELVEKCISARGTLPGRTLGTVGEKELAGVRDLFKTDVLRPQVRRILKKCGAIDPTNMNHYLANSGYAGFERALKMGREKVIGELKESGLRGRGGAGFPTWRKWQFCIESPGDRKYVICNADEGDPGAFMNRSLIEGDPHSVLEGMLIAGYAIGASEGYIYCRAEYPLALERLGIALKQMEEHRLLGENILGSGFSFHIKVKEGAGAFVCGEETALIASIEGKRGMPRPRPPFPAVSGLWGKPTVINNVETLASVALILQNGAGWFAQCGTEKSRGTKTFALAGKVKCTGLIEVPFGIKLREVVQSIGGGILGDKAFKAVQTGGPSGGCLPAAALDNPVDYESLAAAGSIVGSGGMVVMDEDNCMVDVARYFLDFTRKESCGECVPCRLGTKQMLDILQDITAGKGKPEDIDLLLELAQGVKEGSLCGLGQTAPNPVLTTLRYFRSEYEAHVRDKKCPAKVCKALISYRIIEEKCKGCHACFKACPAEAVAGENKKLHVIDQTKCIRCGACLEKCPKKFSAVECLAGRI